VEGEEWRAMEGDIGVAEVGGGDAIILTSRLRTSTSTSTSMAVFVDDDIEAAFPPPSFVVVVVVGRAMDDDMEFRGMDDQSISSSSSYSPQSPSVRFGSTIAPDF
jgi:hypothetical protein